MATSVQPETQDELDRALAKIRGQKAEPAQPSIEDALAGIRGQKRDSGNIDLREPPAPPMRLKPVVVSTPEELPKPIAAEPDVTKVGPESVGLEQQLRNEHPTLLDATVQGVKGMVEHPIDTGIALAETPAKGGYAVGQYVKGGRLNKGKGREAAIGAAQTAAMLLGGPAERVAEPVVATLVGEAAAPLITRSAVGAATGATFTPDRPAVGAIIGGAAGAVSSRGVAVQKRALRMEQFEQMAKEHPDWFGEATPADVETRASRTLANPNAAKATATLAEPQPAATTEPDYTVEEPVAPIIQQKGVFGGALEQHGKDYAEGKVAPPDLSTKPAENVNKNVNIPDLEQQLEHIKSNPPARDPSRALRWDQTYIPKLGDAVVDENGLRGVVAEGKDGLKVRTEKSTSRLVDRYGQSKWYVEGDEQRAHLTAVEAAEKAVEAAKHAEAKRAFDEHMDALPKADVTKLKKGDVLHDVSGDDGEPGIVIFDYADHNGNIFAHEPLGRQDAGFLGDARGLVATGENVNDPAVHRAVMERHHKQLVAQGEAGPEDLPSAEGPEDLSHLEDEETPPTATARDEELAGKSPHELAEWADEHIEGQRDMAKRTAAKQRLANSGFYDKYLDMGPDKFLELAAVHTKLSQAAAGSASTFKKATKNLDPSEYLHTYGDHELIRNAPAWFYKGIQAGSEYSTVLYAEKEAKRVTKTGIKEHEPGWSAKYLADAKARYEKSRAEVVRLMEEAKASQKAPDIDHALQQLRGAKKQTPARKAAKESAAEAKYDYSSTQLDLSPKEAEGIKRLAATIPDEDLAEHGRENTPHITVKYGLHGQPIAKLKKLLEGQGPITLTFGKTSFFPDRGEGDVVKVDVDSPALHALNKKIADALPHTDTFPDYKPHATVAYVKPGLGKKYSGNDALAGEEITIDTLTFSDKGGQTEEIKLREKAPPKRLGQKKPVEPVHESARLPSGRLRDNLAAVKTDGLVREMFQLLGAEDPTDQQRAIYRTVTDDPNMSGPVTVPTIRGGRNLQAEALHRIELKKGAAKRIEAVLNARGLTDEEITRRYAELTETEADIAAEREGLDNDKGDTSFDFGDEEGNNGSDVRVAERTVAPKGANAPAEGAAEEGAAAARQGERAGAPEPQAETDLAGGPARWQQLLDENTEKLQRWRANRERAIDIIQGRASGDVDAQRNGLGKIDDEIKVLNGRQRWLTNQLERAKVKASEAEPSEVARKRAELYHQLHTASTPSARFNVIERIKALDQPKPEIKGAITADEMAERARAGETREAVKDITGEEATPLSRDKKQSEMFGDGEVETPPEPKEQDDLFSMMRSLNGYDQAVHDLWKEAGTHGRLELLDQWRRIYSEQEFLPEWANRDAEDLPAHVRDKIGMERVKQAVALKDLGALQRLDEDWRAPNEKTVSPIAKGLANGVPLGAGTQMYDTEGNASRATLDKLAQRPHTRQMAVRFMAVFDQIHAAIAKRYTFEPVRFGGLDVSMGSVGMNIKPRAGGGNFILTNPYTALMEVGLSGRLRPSEYAAALSERTFATMVHEIAHQPARGHDELFSSYLTRYAGAAAPIAHLVLPELDQAWQVALENGFKDDLVTVQHEVWNHELERHIIRPESTEGSPDRLSLGGDATASYLRPSEGDGGLGEGNGRRRLGVHADVRAGARGSQVEGSERAKSGGPDRADEKGSAGTAAQSPRLKLPEPSGLSQPRSSIRPGEFVRALKAFLNPETLGPEALGAAGTIRHQSAAAYHRVAVTVAALKDLQGRVEKLSREDQVKLWDDAEHGRPIGDPALDEGNRLLRRATEQRTQQLIKLDRLKANRVIENYVGRFWSKTTSVSGRDFLRAIMGRRPLEGPKSFLKARDLDWFVDGLKRADLVPATYNYVESQLAKIAEMERVIAAEHMLRQEKALGRARPIMLGVEPPLDYRGEKWVKIDKTGEDPAFTIYLPPDVPHWEAVDTMVFGKLQKLIDTLNVEHTRAVKIGGNRLGFAEGDKHIMTKFGGAEGVVMHELGHILDARYGLRNEIEKGIGRAPTRTVTKGKRAGKQVPDYKSEDKDAASRRKQLREELRQLANLRRETLAGVPETKDLGQTDRTYLHSWPEKMANMVEAYISARARFQQVAPGIFGIFDRIIEEHPELQPLRDIQPSLSREAHGASTRVPGVITGGHWYAPRDAAAVWNAHLSKGLAGNAIYDAAIAPIHAGTQMLLGFSGFHGTVIATEGAFSDIALAIDNLANKGGVASEAPKQVGRALVSPIAGVSFGRKVMQEYRLPGTHPELKEVLDAMIAGGFRGRATSELWSGDRKDKLKRAFREALFSESKGRRLWGAARLPADALWAGVELASGPLMSKYVPLMKTAATYNAVAQALEKLPLDTPIDELHRIMGDIVKEMDYRFGQVDYDNHFINRVAKDFAQLVFLAPGWTFGTMALAGRGLSDVARLPVRALKAAGGGTGSRSENGEVPPELVGRSAAYWIGAVLGTMLINGTLTYFNTGERPSGKDYFAFRDGTKDAAGNWNRHTVPGYLMHDIYGWAKHPVHTFKNKFAPTLAFMGRLAENKDYFGDQIYDPEAELPTKAKQAGRALVKEHLPLSVQNYLEGKQRGEGGAGEVTRNLFGVTPARRELVRTPAQNKMSEYVALHAPETRTLEEAGKAKLHRDVLAAVRAGDDLPQSAFDAVTEGTLKPKLLGQWIDEATRTSTVAQFKSLTLEQAVTVWDLANDDEKALWAAAFRTKLQNARR